MLGAQGTDPNPFRGGFDAVQATNLAQANHMAWLGQALFHLDDQRGASGHNAAVFAVLVKQAKYLVKAGGAVKFEVDHPPLPAASFMVFAAAVIEFRMP